MLISASYLKRGEYGLVSNRGQTNEMQRNDSDYIITPYNNTI